MQFYLFKNVHTIKNKLIYHISIFTKLIIIHVRPMQEQNANTEEYKNTNITPKE